MDDIYLEGELVFLCNDQTATGPIAQIQQLVNMTFEPPLCTADLNAILWEILWSKTSARKEYPIDQSRSLYNYGRVKITIQFEGEE